jgi:excisionase family DNA binding protein
MHMRGAPRHDDAVGPVLTVSEVADTLRVSSMTVYRLVIGKNIRIRATDLEGYLASGVVASDMQNG